MKGFVNDILITTTTICLLLLGLEILVDYHPNEFSSKYNYWYKNRDQITTLLIGNSHIQSNIDASILGPDAYNMAVGGSNMNHVVKMAETYIPQMSDLKVVIVNFDYLPVYDTPGNSSNNKVDDKKWQNYLNYIHHRYLHIDTSCSCYDHAITCGQLHFKTLLTNNLTDLDLECRQGQEFKDNPYYRIGKSSLQDFYSQVEKIVNIAKLVSKKNGRLVVVTTPTIGTRLHQIDQRNVDLMNNTMDSLSHIYPIVYRNYLIDTSLLHEELFADMQHLNRRGAKIFTKRVVNDFEL